MGHTRLCGSHGRLHHMAVAVVQSGSIGNVSWAEWHLAEQQKGGNIKCMYFLTIICLCAGIY